MFVCIEELDFRTRLQSPEGCCHFVGSPCEPLLVLLFWSGKKWKIFQFSISPIFKLKKRQVKAHRGFQQNDWICLEIANFVQNSSPSLRVRTPSSLVSNIASIIVFAVTCVWAAPPPPSAPRAPALWALRCPQVDRRAFLGEGDWRESADVAILQMGGVRTALRGHKGVTKEVRWVPSRAPLPPQPGISGIQINTEEFRSAPHCASG